MEDILAMVGWLCWWGGVEGFNLTVIHVAKFLFKRKVLATCAFVINQIRHRLLHRLWLLQQRLTLLNDLKVQHHVGVLLVVCNKVMVVLKHL